MSKMHIFTKWAIRAATTQIQITQAPATLLYPIIGIYCYDCAGGLET